MRGGENRSKYVRTHLIQISMRSWHAPVISNVMKSKRPNSMERWKSAIGYADSPGKNLTWKVQT